MDKEKIYNKLIEEIETKCKKCINPCQSDGELIECLVLFLINNGYISSDNNRK